MLQLSLDDFEDFSHAIMHEIAESLNHEIICHGGYRKLVEGESIRACAHFNLSGVQLQISFDISKRDAMFNSTD